MYKKIILGSVLIVSYTILVLILFGYYTSNEKADNYNKSVRMSLSDERSPVGGVFSDSNDDNKIKSSSYCDIKNYSTQEKKVTFVVYQHNILENDYCFFDIDYIYTNIRSESKNIIEDAIVKVPAGEKLSIRIDATARDSSKALTSRSGPSVKIVVLD